MPRIEGRARVQQPIIDVTPIVEAQLPRGLDRVPFFHDAFERIERAAVKAATVRAGVAGQITDLAFAQILHRAPKSPDELAEVKKTAEEMAARGRPMAEITKYVSGAFQALPEAQAVKAAAEDQAAIFNELLGRAPTGQELTNARDYARDGKSREEVRNALRFFTVLGPEYRKLHAAEPVGAAYQKMLGRPPNGDESTRGAEWVRQPIDQGKSGAEVGAALEYVLALTPEWQELHRPKMSTDRDAFYLQQPNGWSCGPTSLSMALAAAGLKPASQATVNEMIGVLGARSGVGTPGSASLIADKARQLGAQAEYNPSRDPGPMREALQRGHGVVVNGDLGGGGHFIYLAGLDERGQYIVCDPYRPGITRWNDAELNAFTHHGNNPPGFAEIWR